MNALSPSSGLFRTLRPLVLASQSPRRRALLAGLGLSFDTLAPQGEPDPRPNEPPALYAERAARIKAEAGAALRPDAVVIGADTIVVLPPAEGEAGSVLGKPADRHEAEAMLARLCGRTHQVITACCLIVPAQAETPPAQAARELFHDRADVTFGTWNREVIRAYAACGEPLDKAGAYAVQGVGSFLISRLNGSWNTVVGLPLEPLIRRLLQRGVIAPIRAGQERCAAPSEIPEQ